MFPCDASFVKLVMFDFIETVLINNLYDTGFLIAFVTKLKIILDTLSLLMGPIHSQCFQLLWQDARLRLCEVILKLFLEAAFLFVCGFKAIRNNSLDQGRGRK